MTSLKEQEDIFKIIGKTLDERVECFVIGGSAMLYHGTKEVTKDIDIVFSDERSRETVIKVLKNLGFKERETRLIYFNKKNVPVLLQREDERIDLFCKKIIHFKLTASIMERVSAVYEHGNLITKIVSPEDIILLKCATERAGDRLDAVEILKKHDIDWKKIFEESIHQMDIGEDVFPVYLYDFLLELKEDLKAEIPSYVLKEIRKIGERAMERVLRRKRIVRVGKVK